MEINKNYNENCLDTMAKMPDGFVDLTVRRGISRGYYENSYLLFSPFLRKKRREKEEKYT